MRTSQKILLMSAAAIVFWAGLAGAAPSNNPSSDAEAAAQVNNAFALTLYASLSGREGNLFFSPFSVSSALAMVYMGGRGNTAKQIARTLHFEGEPVRAVKTLGDMVRDLRDRGKTQQYELAVANALWMSKGRDLLPDYLNLLKTTFGAGVQELDFGANPNGCRRSINTWTEKQTSGKIKDLVPAGMVGPSTKLVITNAIYFKGIWSARFNKDNTSDGQFLTAAGKSVMTPMMTQTGKFTYLEEKTFQILEMDYQGKGLSMVAILPKANDGLPELEKTLTTENVNDWLGRLVEKQVSVYFPRFRLSAKFMLAETLKTMGMTDAFSAPPADFSGIDGRKDLAIDEVVHEAFVDVNEKGTEAAAATAATMEESASLAETEFVADHPFVFMIRDRQSGSILFVGRVVNPAIPSGVTP
jgi:serine protease inhibitor